MTALSYAARIASGRCLGCPMLLVTGEARLCELCRERARRSSLRWVRRHVRGVAQKLWRALNRKRVNDGLRARRLAKKLDGECLDCMKRALADSLYCREHRKAARTRSRKYEQRQAEQRRAA